MTEEEVRMVVRITIEELKRGGLLKGFSDIAYTEAASLIQAFYEDGETDPVIRKAIEDLKEDQYIKIIPLYFSYGYTIEKIAELFKVEISTITRNKKRLCLAIYNAVQ